jgi:cytochrome P450
MRASSGLAQWSAHLRRDAQRAEASAASALSRLLGDNSEQVLALLRRFRPIVATRRFAVVTRADDVREVLRDHEDFTVELYEPKMAALSGPFILGLDGTPLYRRDHAALRAAIRADDLPRLADATLAAARERVSGAVDGEIDVVGQLADPVIDRVIAGYFGTPGPDTPTQLRWSRSLFEEIFLDVGNKPATRDRALADAAEMRPHLDAQIAARRSAIESGADVPDDVLTRLLRNPPADGGLHDIAIRHNLIGLIAGWIPTVSKAFAVVVDELLARPEELGKAQDAARAGDRELVAAYVFEALRFRPQTWAVLRTCAADHTVAAATDRATTIRAGAKVLVAIQSGMFDDVAVTAPREFRVDRPWSDYLHFGHGLHTCFGEQINRVHIPALATALLEGPGIERAPGARGELHWSGPYPSHLRVALSPSPAHL